MKAKKYYYAVQFWSGRKTTTGTPNKTTGYMSKACSCYAFNSKIDRDKWVDNGKITRDMQGNCREAVNKQELRNLNLGDSLNEFNNMIEIMQSEA